MKSKIEQLFTDIKNKKEEIYTEYSKLREKYWFTIKKWKIIFNSDAIKKNKTFKKSLWSTIFTPWMRDFLSIPFIYVVFVAFVILDWFLFMYQQTAFRLYWIPLVKRSDYIIFDRRHLDYLNIIQKFNCIYCSYANWLLSFAVEIAGRTEKYWCPIKHAKKMKWWHDWQGEFADYWDPELFNKKYWDTCDFKKTDK